MIKINENEKQNGIKSIESAAEKPERNEVNKNGYGIGRI